MCRNTPGSAGVTVQPCDLRLAGGQVLLPALGLTEADVLVADGKIAGFCRPSAAVQAREVVAIHGLTLLPGAIDAHVHLGHGRDITVPREPEDATRESSGAAAGGVTTFLPYFMSVEPYERIFEPLVTLTAAGSLVDFGVHFVVCTEEQLDAVPTYVETLGVPSFKFFMNFRGEEGKYLNIPGNDDGYLFRLLERLAQAGGMLCPHPENIELVWALKARAQAMDASPLGAWYESRPPVVEAEALQRVAYLGRLADVPVYSVHTSSADALEVAVAQRSRNARIYIETCPHYLTHDVDSRLGELGKVNPPLRTASDREALWEALRAGVIDTVASDHVARPKDAKAGGIWKASAGFPGMETLLPILISEGYGKRGIPLQRLIDTVSTNPARIFGLYPRKGSLAIGSDADFAVVDLGATYTVEAKDVHSAAGYSLYEGWTVSCRVVHTLVRGTFVKRDGQVQQAAGHGRYCPRRLGGAAAGEA